jgi:hypothetical protein
LLTMISAYRQMQYNLEHIHSVTSLSVSSMCISSTVF